MMMQQSGVGGAAASRADVGSRRRRYLLIFAAAAVALAGCGSQSGHQAKPVSEASVTSGHAAVAGSASSPISRGPTVPHATQASSSTVSGLRNARILDVSFVGSNDGWVLARADCLTGTGGCTALLRSTDRGQHWTPAPPPPANVDGVDGCASPCVEHIAFATAATGYAYGPDAMFLTTDSGKKWTRQPGGADALHTRDGRVIRLLSAHSGCPGPCGLRAQISSVGSSRWQSTPLPGGRIDTGTVALQWTSGGRAFLETSQGQAGSLYSINFYISTDRGRRWTQRPDPCRSVATAAAGVPMASSQMTVGPTDGSLSILCTDAGGSKALVITTINGGSSFSTGRVVAANQFGDPLSPIGSASAAVIISTSGSSGLGLYRSGDGGRTWTKVLTESGNGDVHTPVFTTTTTGYWSAPNGRTLWTTHDTGRTWTATNFA